MDRMPQALIVGGYPQDRGAYVSSVARAGLRVIAQWEPIEDHWPASLPKGLDVVIVIRDTLAQKPLSRIANLANAHKVPFVKWDRDWPRFRERLEMAGALPPQERAKLETPAGVDAVDVKPRATVSADLGGLEGAVKAALELLHESLARHPIYRGAAMLVEDDGAALVKMTAREVRFAPRPEVQAPPPRVEEPRIDPKVEIPKAPPPRSLPPPPLGLLKQGGQPRRKFVRRSAEITGDLRAKLAAYVKAHEGSHMTEISRALGVPSRALSWPAKCLVKARTLRQEGVKSHARYFAG